MSDLPTSPSFPNGLPPIGSEAEARAARRLSMLDVIAPKRDRHWLVPTSVSNRFECPDCGRMYDATPDEGLPDYCSEDCPSIGAVR